MVTTTNRPIFDRFPKLREQLTFADLGSIPTTIVTLDGAGFVDGRCFVKRDDLISPIYAGNKIRTLEPIFGRAVRRGITRIYATGAFGSNHAAATVLHAPQVGLEAGVVLFPQPPSAVAAENLKLILSNCQHITALRHWSQLPFSMARITRDCRRSRLEAKIMVPGGATPHGALGYVSAGLELADQIDSGELPKPDEVIVGVGSTCTAAGLLLGFFLAAKYGIGFVGPSGRAMPPLLVGARVSPWPVTSPLRVINLAVRTSHLLAKLAQRPGLMVSFSDLHRYLEIDRRFIGGGYGMVTPSGISALRRFSQLLPGFSLDTTYSAKSAACLIARHQSMPHKTMLYWATKSSVQLPCFDKTRIERAPTIMMRWIRKAMKQKDFREGSWY